MQKREKVLGNLRKELRIGEDTHAEIMDCVLSGKEPPRLIAAATARYRKPLDASGNTGHTLLSTVS